MLRPGEGDEGTIHPVRGEADKGAARSRVRLWRDWRIGVNRDVGCALAVQSAFLSRDVSRGGGGPPSGGGGGGRLRDGGNDNSRAALDCVSSEPHNANSLFIEPLRAPCVPGRAFRVRWSVDLDTQARRGTIEVENLRTYGMLTAKVQAELVPPQDTLERPLRLRESAAQTLRPFLRQDRCAHGPVRGAAPSTMLRMVPLPRGFATVEESRLRASAQDPACHQSLGMTNTGGWLAAA